MGKKNSALSWYASYHKMPLLLNVFWARTVWGFEYKPHIRPFPFPIFVINDTFREWILSFPVKNIARQKNPVEPKDVVKNWLRSKTPWSIWDLETVEQPSFQRGRIRPPFERSGFKCFYNESNSVGGTYQCSRYVRFTASCGSTKLSTCSVDYHSSKGEYWWWDLYLEYYSN